MEQKLELIVDIDESGFISGIRQIDKAEDKLAKDSVNRSDKQEKAFKKLGGAIKSLGNMYTAIIGGVVVGALGKAVKSASDFEESNSKFLVTFGAVGKEANKMRQELVNSFNLSNKSATELLANTGNMLSGFGFATDKALELSGATNKLAADLSSFANVPIEQASEAITKGLLGEREMMKTLGIAISEADVQQRLLAEGKDKLTGMALKQAKAEVTLALAMEQSKNALGDAQRTQGSFANQMRKMQNIFTDLSIMIGQKLMGLIAPLIEDFNKFAKSEEGMRKISIAIKSIVTGIVIMKDVVGITFSFVISYLQNLWEASKKVGEGLYKLFTGDFKGAFESMKGGIAGFVSDSIDNYAVLIESAKKTVKTISGIWDESNKLQIEGLNNVLTEKELADKEAEASEKELTDKIKEEAEKRKEIQKNLEEGKQEIIAKSAEFVMQSINAVAELSKRASDERINQLEKERQTALDNLKFEIDERNIFSEQLKEIEERELEEKLARMQAEKDQAILNGDEELAKQLEADITKQELAMNEKARAEEIAKAKEQAEADRIKAEEQINKEYNDRIRKEKIKAYKKQRVADILTAGVNTALGITSALASPFPLNTILPAIIGASGLVQVGLIASKPIPQFNQGGNTGIVSGGMSYRKDSIPAMLAPEENIFNKPQSNNLFNALDRAGLLSSGSQNRVMENKNINNNNQQSVVINGDVRVEKTTDIFDKSVNRRLAMGGTFN